MQLYLLFESFRDSCQTLDGERDHAGIIIPCYHGVGAFAMNLFKKFKDYVLGEVRSLG